MKSQYIVRVVLPPGESCNTNQITVLCYPTDSYDQFLKTALTKLNSLRDPTAPKPSGEYFLCASQDGTKETALPHVSFFDMLSKLSRTEDGSNYLVYLKRDALKFVIRIESSELRVALMEKIEPHSTIGQLKDIVLQKLVKKGIPSGRKLDVADILLGRTDHEDFVDETHVMDLWKGDSARWKTNTLYLSLHAAAPPSPERASIATTASSSHISTSARTAKEWKKKARSRRKDTEDEDDDEDDDEDGSRAETGDYSDSEDDEKPSAHRPRPSFSKSVTPHHHDTATSPTTSPTESSSLKPKLTSLFTAIARPRGDKKISAALSALSPSGLKGRSSNSKTSPPTLDRERSGTPSPRSQSRRGGRDGGSRGETPPPDSPTSRTGRHQRAMSTLPTSNSSPSLTDVTPKSTKHAHRASITPTHGPTRERDGFRAGSISLGASRDGRGLVSLSASSSKRGGRVSRDDDDKIPTPVELPLMQKQSLTMKIAYAVTLEEEKESGQGKMCFKCSNLIPFGEAVRALNRHWHKRCFTCQKCRKLITTKKFVRRKEQPFCSEPCLRSLICDSCGEIVKTDFFYVGDLQLHAHCFACVKCRKKLNDEYSEHRGQPFCEQCLPP